MSRKQQTTALQRAQNRAAAAAVITTNVSPGDPVMVLEVPPSDDDVIIHSPSVSVPTVDVGEGYSHVNELVLASDEYYRNDREKWRNVPGYLVGILPGEHLVRRRIPVVVQEPVIPLTREQHFRKFILSADGLKVTDTRVPTDPMRLGGVLDDNARISFVAGFVAAGGGGPEFE